MEFTVGLLQIDYCILSRLDKAKRTVRYLNVLMEFSSRMLLGRSSTITRQTSCLLNCAGYDIGMSKQSTFAR